MNTTNSLLELTDITKRYDVKDTEAAPVLKEISLTVQPGETLAIVGPSGSGKSTLLNIIGSLDEPTSGTVLLEGQDIASLNDKELAAIRNQKIGFIFQEHHLLPQCTVLENVLVPTMAGANRSNHDPAAQARQLLQEVGLEHRICYYPGQLSGGEKQRVAVVRALINSPKLLLADEPTGSLDKTSSENLVNLLVELNRKHQITLIMVTHSLQMARRMAKVLELTDGLLCPWSGEK
jgi:ABC-type lipoprotein export system ATPase subunit